ncbi:MAG: hypothetical protein D6788_05250 [Planctomycetota bacterium]|nr:MAG: hypothetical protein D6788_05250 [Planctomycetota bacterium]
MDIRVTGPGWLTPGGDSPVPGEEKSPAAESRVTFEQELTAEADRRTETRLTRGGALLREEVTALRHARFTGGVHFRRAETDVEAESMELWFARRRGLWGGGDDVVRRIVGNGSVTMREGDDRLTCDRIELTLETDEAGRPLPKKAVATGHVVARQQSRTIRADDRLVLHLVRRDVPASPSSSGRGEKPSGADADGSVSRSGNESLPSTSRSSGNRTRIAVSRLEASGHVAVSDPQQKIDVTAVSLEAEIDENNELHRARILGDDDQPASVSLESFTVTGPEIRLDAAKEWAEVPAAGRLTFQSRKDLDGRRVKEPIPVLVTWADWMRYQGEKNQAVFTGQVHAATETTTFDCDRLLVEFEKKEPPAEPPPTPGGMLEELFQTLRRQERRSPRRATREPVYLLATGRAVVLTSEYDETSDRLLTRARLAGPRLSVNLRPDVSKMMIEGAGNLLLEDYRPAPPNDARPPRRTGGGLFRLDDNGGPSTTLIEWDEWMWYDFAVRQTRFVGNVRLKHLSGTELERLRGERTSAQTVADTPGRATFLTCRELTVEFASGSQQRGPAQRRMGGLRSERIKQFQAEGTVALQDQGEGLSLKADRVVYWKDRNGLAVYGTRRRPARIVLVKPNRLPQQATVEKLFYNFETGRLELFGADLKGR